MKNMRLEQERTEIRFISVGSLWAGFILPLKTLAFGCWPSLWDLVTALCLYGFRLGGGGDSHVVTDPQVLYSLCGCSTSCSQLCKWPLYWALKIPILNVRSVFVGPDWLTGRQDLEQSLAQGKYSLRSPAIALVIYEAKRETQDGCVVWPLISLFEFFFL